MARSPETPNKGNPAADELSYKGAAALPHDKVNSTSMLQQTSMHEPSPASTYGDTAGSRSVPATPQDYRVSSATSALERSLLAAELDTSIESISVSPAGKPTVYISPQRRAGGIRAGAMTASPPSSAGVAAFGPGHQSSAHSSPTATRYKNIVESPSWRQHGDFVRQSGGSSEDPFVSDQAAAQGPSQANDQTFHPREDRAGMRLSGDNAQAILPPNACVFVANLVSSKSDDQLEFSVHNAFQAFGNCYVKIRRDNKGMPFAFCQYEYVDDAQRAITCGRGMHIDGRPCRTEVAKVNRSLYLSKVTGEPIPEAEAREIMGRYGELERVWFCTQTDKEMFRLPEGIWVMFAFFQDCRDAQAGFRDHHLYRLEQPRMPDEVRAHMATRGFGPPAPLQLGSSPDYARRPYTSPRPSSRRTIDQNSIFVGNLPSFVNEQMLRSTFGAYGLIKSIEIVRKPSVNVSGQNIFAFVEYHDREEAGFATQQTVNMQGVRLRVEQKESIESNNRRDPSSWSGGSPHGRYIADSQDALALLFQRGVSVGMANAANAANAAATQGLTLSAANYNAAAYPYYPQFNQPQYGPHFPPAAMGWENESPLSLQTNGNMYAPNGMGQIQYSKAPPQHVQYPHYPQAASRPTNYEWPPSNDGNLEASSPAGDETH